jgi:hypothetical protein
VRRDLRVVETLRDALENFRFPCREFRKSARALGTRWDKRSHLLEEPSETGLMLEQDVILGFEGHQAGIGDEAGEVTALLERRTTVVSRVKKQGRARHLRREMLDVDVEESTDDPNRILRGSRAALQLAQ